MDEPDIKEATVKRYHYDSHQQFEMHLDDFIAAYNFGRRLKTLKGLTPYGFICKRRTVEPKRFTLDPLHQMPAFFDQSGRVGAPKTHFP